MTRRSITGRIKAGLGPSPKSNALESKALGSRYQSYREYKSIKVEGLGGIPAHWTVQRLKNVASINDEVLPENTDPMYELLYVDISSVDSLKGILDKEELTFKDSPSRARRIVRAGDVIVSTVRTYLMAIAEIKEAEANLVVSTGFAVVRPKWQVYGCFGAYALKASYLIDRIVAESVGVSFPAINADEIGCLPVVLPPRQEQQAIVKFLDRETAKIDRLLINKELVIKLLQEKRTNLIARAVTKGIDPGVPMRDSGVEWIGEIPAHWSVMKIKRLCLVRRGASPRPIDNPDYFDDDGEYAWVRIADVTASERYLEKTTQRLSQLGKSKSVPLEPGALFVSIAATVGKPIITRTKCCIHDGFVYFVNLRQDLDYFYYILSCGEAYKGLGKLGTQLNLNTDTIGSIYVPIPPVIEQRRIVEELDHANAEHNQLLASIQQAIRYLQELRSALISAAVTGKIDVRGEAV